MGVLAHRWRTRANGGRVHPPYTIPQSPREVQIHRNHFAFAISTANAYEGPNILDRKMIHFMSGVKTTLGSKE